MKNLILCVSLVVFSHSMMAAVPMARFSKVIDSHTIVVERTGGTEVVHLSNVNIPSADEEAARDYLFEKLTGAYVYVENGNVYRSPDALFINRELAYGAYASSSVKMRVFGEVNPGPRPQKSAAPVRAPMQVPKPRPASHHTRRR
jgi:hypothetical protein